MGRFFLGVDGGQTSTMAMIGDDKGRVLSHGRGGPCNHIGAAEGRAKFISAISSSVGEALEQAGLGKDTPFVAACLGFSGGAADKEPLLKEIIHTPLLRVTHDALIALSGAMAGGPGVITVAGTGSISFGRNADGRTARTGGWGYIFGDEGGGFDLTRQALRAVLRMEEGWGPETTLRARLLEATGTQNANDLLHRFYTTEYPRPRVAQLSRVVVETADAGDRIALDLLHHAAAQLAGITGACRRQLFPPDSSVAVAPIGGVFNIAAVRAKFVQLVELDGLAKVAEPKFGPAAGALIEAYRLGGVQLTLTSAPGEK